MLNLGRETNVTWNYINKGRLLNIFKYVGISDVTVFSAYSISLAISLKISVRFTCVLHEKYRFLRCDLSQNYMSPKTFHENDSRSLKF